MYSVIILAEQALSAADAHEVVNLHDGIEDERRYFILIPAENAQLRVEAALGSLGASDTWASPGVDLDGTETQEVQQSLNARAQAEVSKSVAAVRALGHLAAGEYRADDPVDSLADLVATHQADEVIVMTRPHVVQEFFHLDWTSKARRRLGVPVLHLVEHEDPAAEASTGQGITGM